MNVILMLKAGQIHIKSCLLLYLFFLDPLNGICSHYIIVSTHCFLVNAFSVLRFQLRTKSIWVWHRVSLFLVLKLDVLGDVNLGFD